ncbi:hypothetical protein M9H77_25917 [Catharanthus roseus]|uniref:Uncharacterized protein n=1 Tax=Catharanthus roseus TaxID=4058 RepID=A0ACC0A923_CATRO|nr:hypothetical protein M9H77_25917 [Catharanthus roseus]
MEYHWSNSLWQRIEAMRKQENYQSKLAKDMYNYYHGLNEVNAYDGNNHGHGNFNSRGHDSYGNFNPKRHNGVGGEYFECSKEKEYELEKSESTKENECFIEKQESIEEEQKEKEVVVLDKYLQKYATRQNRTSDSINRMPTQKKWKTNFCVEKENRDIQTMKPDEEAGFALFLEYR